MVVNLRQGFRLTKFLKCPFSKFHCLARHSSLVTRHFSIIPSLSSPSLPPRIQAGGPDWSHWISRMPVPYSRQPKEFIGFLKEEYKGWDSKTSGSKNIVFHIEFQSFKVSGFQGFRVEQRVTQEQLSSPRRRGSRRATKGFQPSVRMDVIMDANMDANMRPYILLRVTLHLSLVTRHFFLSSASRFTPHASRFLVTRHFSRHLSLPSRKRGSLDRLPTCSVIHSYASFSFFAKILNCVPPPPFWPLGR